MNKKDCLFIDQQTEKKDLVGFHIRVGYPGEGILDAIIVKYDQDNDIFLIYQFYDKKLVKWEPEFVEEIIGLVKVV